MNKEDFQKLIGKQIIKIRSSKGMGQSDLARATFKDRQNIERIENGKNNPTAFFLYQLAKAMKIHIKEIFDFDIPNKDNP